MTPLDAVLIFAAIGLQRALVVMVGLGIIGVIALPLWLLFSGLPTVVAFWVGETTRSTSGASVAAPAREYASPAGSRHGVRRPWRLARLPD